MASHTDKYADTHLDAGRFRIRRSELHQKDRTTGIAPESSIDNYWTNPLPFSLIPERSPELLEELQKADLVIFKGDLNYRKLTRCVDSDRYIGLIA